MVFFGGDIYGIRIFLFKTSEKVLLGLMRVYDGGQLNCHAGHDGSLRRRDVDIGSHGLHTEDSESEGDKTS
jgi:hypothetical protein